MSAVEIAIAEAAEKYRNWGKWGTDFFRRSTRQ
jgi:hypothetical protein